MLKTFFCVGIAVMVVSGGVRANEATQPSLPTAIQSLQTMDSSINDMVRLGKIQFSDIQSEREFMNLQRTLFQVVSDLKDLERMSSQADEFGMWLDAARTVQKIMASFLVTGQMGTFQIKKGAVQVQLGVVATGALKELQSRLGNVQIGAGGAASYDSRTATENEFLSLAAEFMGLLTEAAAAANEKCDKRVVALAKWANGTHFYAIDWMKAQPILSQSNMVNIIGFCK